MCLQGLTVFQKSLDKRNRKIGKLEAELGKREQVLKVGWLSIDRLDTALPR
jgi:hypothetical protein